MEELKILIQEAKKMGIPNQTMYLLLPENKRVNALKKDISRAKQSATADE